MTCCLFQKQHNQYMPLIIFQFQPPICDGQVGGREYEAGLGGREGVFIYTPASLY